MEELNTCPVCEREGSKGFIVCKDYTVSGNSFNIVACDHCGFCYTNPRPAEGEIGKYYESEEYISHSNTKKGIVNSLYQAVRGRTIKRKYRLARKYAANNLILDYGCGTGEFLNYCKSQNMQVAGFEPSPARDFASNNYGIDILSWEKVNQLEQGSLGVITMWHVLEHVHKLKEVLKMLANKLNTKGALIVAVPNMNSWDAKYYKEYWAAYDVPRHLYHFTPKDIEQLFLEFDMKVEKVLPMKYDAFYVSLLSEKYKTGQQSLLKGFFNGLRSNFNASEKTYSSQIYILKKS